MRELASESETVDLSNCDREPIHSPGSIQPHGVLLTIDPATLKVIQVAGDATHLLGLDPDKVLGQGVETLVTQAELEGLRTLAAQDATIPRSTFAFEMGVEHCGEKLDAIVHQSDGALVIELERRSINPPLSPLALVQGMITGVQKAPDLPGFLQKITEEVRAATGFDRVMVYQFQPDQSGAVLAEAKTEDLSSFVGLRYPASDIPKQARELYLCNRTRIIPDARYTPAPLTPALNPLTGRPLDLSFSVLRAVSPLHLEYLANMGVAASMSFSLVIGGDLWGLIACHHREPRHLSQSVRSSCELFAQLISLQLSEKLANEAHTERLRIRRVHAELVNAMVGQDNLGEALIRTRPSLLDYIPAEGVAVWWEGRVTRLGVTPSDEQLGPLVSWLNASRAEGVFITDCLAAHFAQRETTPASQAAFWRFRFRARLRTICCGSGRKRRAPSPGPEIPRSQLPSTTEAIASAQGNPSQRGRKLCENILSPGASSPARLRRCFASPSWMSCSGIRTRSCASVSRSGSSRIS